VYNNINTYYVIHIKDKMGNEKPENIEKYKKWLKKEHGYEISVKYSTYYETVSNQIKLNFIKSDFWKLFNKNLIEYHDAYSGKKGYPLLTKFKPELLVKPFDSFLLKTYRKNIIENENWPNEPKVGWLLPENWFSRVDDIVRTLLVVKYLDGIKFLIGRIMDLCNELDQEGTFDFEAKEEGYYAAHFYIKEKIDIPKEDWDSEKIDCLIEIQITSQLQEVIRTILHKYYEKRRKELNLQKDIKWQWDYKSNEFITNYLGHILHYVEGMIVEIRDRQKKEEKNGK